MSNWLVELEAPTFSDFFRLDDPVKGVLNNTEHRLGGDYVNITSRVRQISVNRGRSKLLEKFTAGSCSIVLDNRDRYFDPTNVDSPFYGEILPRKDVRISYLGEPVFTGSVSDWNFDYTFSDATAEIVAHDAFTKLATTNVPVGTLVSESIVDRFNTVLDLVNWDADLRDIDNDLLILAEEIIAENVNTLGYLQKIELSSSGLLFMDKAGTLKYIFRYQGDAVNLTVGVDDGIPTNAFNVTFGSEELANNITVNYVNSGGEAFTTLVDEPSQTAYGVLERSFDTLLADDVEAENLAQLILERYKNPTYRIDEIGFNIDGLSAEQIEDLMALELGNRIKLKWQPLGVGDIFYRSVIIDTISHSATPAMHELKMKVTDIGQAIETLASGGSYTTDFVDPTDGELYRMHVYDTVGTFDFTIDGSLDLEVLIIGGGGARRSQEDYAGGGGGGAVVTGELELVGTQTISVTVGDGGVMLPGTPTVGGNSSFGTYVAPGGGMGGVQGGNGGDGGNGGGASGNALNDTLYSGGSSVHDSVSPLTFYGNNGGANVIGGGNDRGGHGGSANYTSTFTGVERTYGIGGRGFSSGSIGIPGSPGSGPPPFPLIGSYGQGEGKPTIFIDGVAFTLATGTRIATQGAVFIRYIL
jgi:hypothetical protein